MNWDAIGAIAETLGAVGDRHRTPLPAHPAASPSRIMLSMKSPNLSL